MRARLCASRIRSCVQLKAVKNRKEESFSYNATPDVGCLTVSRKLVGGWVETGEVA
jgi:hypothetical protein